MVKKTMPRYATLLRVAMPAPHLVLILALHLHKLMPGDPGEARHFPAIDSAALCVAMASICPILKIECGKSNDGCSSPAGSVACWL